MGRFSLLALLLLAGCATHGAGITCPTLRQYSQSFLAQSSSEFKAVKATSPHLVTMINDYGVERDAIRKCQGLRKKSRK